MFGAMPRGSSLLEKIEEMTAVVEAEELLTAPLGSDDPASAKEQADKCNNLVVRLNKFNGTGKHDVLILRIKARRAELLKIVECDLPPQKNMPIQPETKPQVQPTILLAIQWAANNKLSAIISVIDKALEKQLGDDRIPDLPAAIKIRKHEYAFMHSFDDTAVSSNDDENKYFNNRYYYATGMSFFYKGNYEAALINFKIIEPTDGQVLRRTASCYLKMGELDKAIEACFDWLKALPQGSKSLKSVLISIVAVLTVQREIKEAESNLTPWVYGDHLADQASLGDYEAGVAFYNSENYEKAFEQFSLVKQPNYNVLRRMGDCHLAFGNFPEAKGKYSEAKLKAQSEEEAQSLNSLLEIITLIMKRDQLLGQLQAVLEQVEIKSLLEQGRVDEACGLLREKGLKNLTKEEVETYRSLNDQLLFQRRSLATARSLIKRGKYDKAAEVIRWLKDGGFPLFNETKAKIAGIEEIIAANAKELSGGKK